MKPTNPELASFISDLCFLLGLNTAHDYEGIENDEDVEIYSKAIKREINKLKIDETN